MIVKRGWRIVNSVKKIMILVLVWGFLLGSNAFTVRVYASNDEMFYRALQIDSVYHSLNLWGNFRDVARLDEMDPSVRPIIHEGRAMLPMRATTGLIGWADGLLFYDVDWHDGERKAVLSLKHDDDPDFVRPIATFWIGSNTAVYYCDDGNPREVEIPAAPVIIGGRTYLPLRAVFDAVDGVEVEWVEAARGIVIYFPGSRPSNVTFPDGSTHRF